MKAKSENIQAPRGMRDLLPLEMALREAVTATVLAVYHRHGFARIETPAMENLSFLARESAGENSKLIFPILKRGEALSEALTQQNIGALADLGLRFDLTVPLVRYYISHRAKLPSLFKAIQVGPVWRAERPQKGRYRQFQQCDIDMIGTTSALCEIELLQTSAAALCALNLKDFIIRVNDRRLLTALAASCGFPAELHDKIFITLDKLDKIGVDGVRTELHALFADARPTEVLLEKIAADNAVDLQHFCGSLKDHLDVNIVSGLDALLRELTLTADNQYRCVFDPTLVRGMGYYTGPIFEISYGDYPFSIAGGGRYDHMIHDLAGIEAPACGISLGLDRIMMILSEQNLFSAPSSTGIALIYDKSTHISDVMAASRAIDGASLFPRQKNFGKQLTELLACGITTYQTIDVNGNISAAREIK